MFYPHSISTRLTRIATRDVCKYRDPCHVYLMVGSDMAHEMILHVHSSHKYGNLTVFIDTTSRAAASGTAQPLLPSCRSRFLSPLSVIDSSAYSYHFGSQEYVMTHLETERVIYYSSLVNLTADTRYWFRVVDSAPLSGYSPVFSQEYSFITAPAAGLSSKNFSFVTGGGTVSHRWHSQ
jgi:hypothetical protein